MLKLVAYRMLKFFTASRLKVFHNYFDDLIKLFPELYLTKFSDTSKIVLSVYKKIISRNILTVF